MTVEQDPIVAKVYDLVGSTIDFVQAFHPSSYDELVAAVRTGEYLFSEAAIICLFSQGLIAPSEEGFLIEEMVIDVLRERLGEDVVKQHGER